MSEVKAINSLVESPGNSTPSGVADRRFGVLMGTSARIQAVYQKIEDAAAQTEPVFITGETGTGKKLCAQAIHKHSGFSDRPFIPLHCGLLTTEKSSSGNPFEKIPDKPFTLLLDGITDMPFQAQSQLLGLMHARKKIRYICNSCDDPYQSVQEGRLRKDLFYRLCKLAIHMPALRDCEHDVLDFAHAMLRDFSRAKGKSFQAFSSMAELLLRHYPWPGNFRELENVIYQAVLAHDGLVMETGMLPCWLRAGTPCDGRASAPNNGRTEDVLPLRLTEKQAIEKAIGHCNGNITKAARMLEISTSTIYRKMATWSADES